MEKKFTNKFYDSHAVKPTGSKLSEQFDVHYQPKDYTPDGYTINEGLYVTDKKTGKGFQIHKDGEASYATNYVDTISSEAYAMMGIDENSKEFKEFQENIKKDFSAKTVEDFLEKAPTLSREQQVEKLNQFTQEEKEAEAKWQYIGSAGYYADNYQEQIKDRIDEKELVEIIDKSIAKTSFLDTHKDVEKVVVTDLNKIIDERDLGDKLVAKEVYEKQKELSEQGKTEIAKPGRTYSGNVVEVGEDVTVQKTKTGKFIIHETENLPGIKEVDEKTHLQIRYDNGKQGDIIQKGNDLEIGKQKEIEQQYGMER